MSVESGVYSSEGSVPTQDGSARTWVMDAGPLLANFTPPEADVANRGDRLVTIAAVVSEIKDRASRERVQEMVRDGRLAVLPVDPASRAEVVRFCQETGDFASLSATDISLLALARQLAPSNASSPASLSSSSPSSPSSPSLSLPSLSSPAFSSSSPAAVCVVSDDYAVQNVSMQLKLATHSSAGLIRSLKHFLLRCHACFWISTKTDVKFCGKCGNYQTLCKTSYSVDAKTGERRLWLKENYQYNLRGTKFSLGGSNSKVILREDQREFQRHLKAEQRQKDKAERGIGIDDPDVYLERAFGDAFRGLGDISSAKKKSGNKGNYQLGSATVAHGRRNPNEVRR